ncbi:hypothetical protein [Peribacillus sp. TH24]|uniref:hypothetical protein n=1 Tax=Peribacillus sp. TH24 TaxID=2798483 RepID=UPI001912D2DE|nr:hypothetical protein [Peribacillus sp. TH24]MBK5444701.1 hypothetical protein [Peribacillus sp. TH24]
MKRLLIFILMMALIVSGCTTRNYDSNMELGKSQVEEENYLEAHEAFELAYKEDQTGETKELMELCVLLADGMKKYEEQDFEAAQVFFEEAAAYKANYEKGKLMVQKAIGMSSENGEASAEPVEDTEAEQSRDESENPVTESEEEDEPVEAPATSKLADKGNHESNKDLDKTLTKAQAENLVKDYADMENYPQLQIQYDREDEKGDYIFQVFEMANDSKGSGHKATWGWYGVNKKTKEVYELM